MNVGGGNATQLSGKTNTGSNGDGTDEVATAGGHVSGAGAGDAGVDDSNNGHASAGKRGPGKVLTAASIVTVVLVLIGAVVAYFVCYKERSGSG